MVNSADTGWIVRCENAAEIKAAILDGKLAQAKRRSGKTTILMEAIHEKHQGRAVVVCLNHLMACHFYKTYRDEYCRHGLWKRLWANITKRELEKPPKCLPFHGLLDGSSLPLYVDNASYFLDAFVRRNGNVTIAGGTL